jgi:hypothetical protein
MQTKFEILANKYGTLSSASSYRQELNYSVANPEEEELTKNDIVKLKVIIAELNEYLELGEER